MEVNMFTEEELINKPKRIQEENDRLVDLFFNTPGEDVDINDLIEKYASEEYKQ